MKRPTVEDIQEYMTEKGFVIHDQAETFFDHFESKGWMIGKSKMKCWKAATRNWIRNAKKWSKPNEKSNGHKQSFADRQREQAQRAMQAMGTGSGSVNAGDIRAIR